MSGGEYFGSYPTGRQVQPSASEWPFGQEFYSALPEFVEWCRQQGWEELTEAELDFSVSRKKVIDRRDGSYFRFHMSRIEDADEAGVSAFCVRDGQLVLLHRPNSERVSCGLASRPTRFLPISSDSIHLVPSGGGLHQGGGFIADDGWRPPAAERRQSVLEEQRVRVNQHLPQQPMIFGGSGPESHERYERRQRQRRIDAILKKYDIGHKPGLWWRI